MNRFSQTIYASLPPWWRSLAASAHGLRLRRLRYGDETEQLVEAAFEREYWSITRWNAWREERLAFILHRAATRVPYYRRYWSDRRQHGDGNPWERIENWPALEKDAVRNAPEAFVADDCPARRMHTERTSGTTGTPLRLFRSRRTLRAWYALFEARCRRWNGVTRNDRWAILSGQIVTPFRQRKPPFWVWNAPMRQLYMSAYHIAPELAGYYLDAIERHRVRYLLGYSSSLAALAEQALRNGRRLSEISVVLTNAEPVYDHQRGLISAAFNCLVRETYGMSEIVAAASECNCGALHLWPEVGHMEVLENERGGSGDFVCTSLLDEDMPLIRYRLGDRGKVPAPEPCRCGRTLPVLSGLEGRCDDVLYTADGRVVGRLDSVFKADIPIRAAQITQYSLTKLTLRYVPGPRFGEAGAAAILREIRSRLGEVQVVLEPVEQIPLGPNGKFRAVVSHVRPSRERSLAAAQVHSA